MNRSTGASHKFSITKLYDLVAPLRCISIRSNHKPWIPPQIHNLMDKRDKAYQLATKTGKPTDHEMFCQLRRESQNNWKLDESTGALSQKRELNKFGITKRRHATTGDHHHYSTPDPEVLNQYYASMSKSNSPLVELVQRHHLSPTCNCE